MYKADPITTNPCRTQPKPNQTKPDPTRSGSGSEGSDSRQGGGNEEQLVVLLGLFLPLLSPHLQHFAVAVGVHMAREGRTARRPVLGEEAARLVADPTSVAKSFCTLRPRPPLRGLVHAAVAALPLSSTSTSTAHATVACAFSQ